MRVQRLSDGTETAYAVVFETGEDPVEGLTVFAEQETLSAARLVGIGAFREAMLGFFDMERKDYERIPVTEQTEVASLLGDLALKDGAPTPHLHAVLARRDGSAVAGHLLQAVVQPTLEVMVVETPAHLRRRIDRETGLPLLAPEH